jgi:hypothetical protein
MQKIRRNKPTGLKEGCVAASGEVIDEKATQYGVSRCNAAYPFHGDPRLVAGGPLAGNVLKCALKPVDAADYPGSMTAAQLDQIKLIFPTGVCDYHHPGIGQHILHKTWQHF